MSLNQENLATVDDDEELLSVPDSVLADYLTRNETFMEWWNRRSPLQKNVMMAVAQISKGSLIKFDVGKNSEVKSAVDQNVINSFTFEKDHLLQIQSDTASGKTMILDHYIRDDKLIIQMECDGILAHQEFSSVETVHAFAGTWEHKESVNYDVCLKAAGVGVVARRVANLKPLLFIEVIGDNWVIEKKFFVTTPASVSCILHSMDLRSSTDARQYREFLGSF